jgi:hypothetical protein
LIDYDKLITALNSDKEIKTLIDSEAHQGYGYFAEYRYKGVSIAIKYDGDIKVTYRIGDSCLDEYIRDLDCPISYIKKTADRVKVIDTNRKSDIYQMIYDRQNIGRAIDRVVKGVDVRVSGDMGDIFLKFSYKGELYVERVDFGVNIESIINETVGKIIARKETND